MKIISIVGITIVALTAVTIVAQAHKPATSGKSVPVVDGKGNLRVPANYQTSYEYLGSWAIAAEQGQGSKELHNVYASPGTIETYRKNGKFSDGAVLVKEVFEPATKQM